MGSRTMDLVTLGFITMALFGLVTSEAVLNAREF